MVTYPSKVTYLSKSHEEKFERSTAYKVALERFKYRVAAPEAFDESHEYQDAFKRWSKRRIIDYRARAKSFACFAIGALSGLSLLTCVHAENPNTSLKQGEPHPGCSLVKPEGTDLRKAL